MSSDSEDDEYDSEFDEEVWHRPPPACCNKCGIALVAGMMSRMLTPPPPPSPSPRHGQHMLEFLPRERHRLLQEAVLANATAPGQAAEDREPINNVEALEEALEDIAWPATVGWLEAQVCRSISWLQPDRVSALARPCDRACRGFTQGTGVPVIRHTGKLVTA